ncbi:MAG: helix-turn-helix domain-containing protein [Acidimicrobiia bacterium]
MIHRHLDYPADSDLEELPMVAIADLLERGDLNDWRPLAATIAREPFGDVAERVARVIDSFPMYGTSALWRAYLERRRAAVAGYDLNEPSRLGELRRYLGITQTELASRLHISQSDLSKLERRADWRLSTVRRYVAALGGDLRLKAILRRR